MVHHMCDQQSILCVANGPSYVWLTVHPMCGQRSILCVANGQPTVRVIHRYTQAKADINI